jgi:hypothetical protein
LLWCALPIEPYQHRGILRHLKQEIAKVAERILAEEFDLSLWAAQHAGFVREHLGRLRSPRVGGQLAVGGGEVVVPEQRHLFLQRTPRVDHAEQPALARVLDVDIRRKEVFDGDLRMVGPSDARINVVGSTLVVNEIRDGSGRRHVAKNLGIGGTDAESGAAKQVIDLRVDLGHFGQSAIVTTPSVKLVAN